ncbi:STM3941 family protein [Actinoplanes sp. NPDC026670]|uniref:STM3941 family protein n=1 Tax=Actinoplanes sp. NPDC026670 TaxID=3154700 RepID=UPI00340F2170
MLVYRSLPKTAGLLVAAFALIAASAFMAWGSRPGPSFDVLLFVIGVFGVLFFGFGAVRVGQQMFRRGPVVEVSIEGVRDVRMSPQIIPWHVVRGVEQVVVQRQRFVVVLVEESFEKQYLTGGKRMLQQVNRQIGFHGVNIVMTGMTVSADDLQKAIVRYWQEATPGPARHDDRR